MKPLELHPRAELSAPATVALSPLTGRDTEVSLLMERWEQAQEQMGQIVTIVGEPGLGKSRLVQTIKEHVRDGARSTKASSSPTIEWRCTPQFQNTGLHVVADYFERMLDFTAETSTSIRFDRLAQHLDDLGLGGPETVALFAKLLFLPEDERYPTPGLTPVREREETFRVIREWLHAQANRRAMLFVVEDLHWADASTIELLGQFVAEGPPERMLTVLTSRPEFHPPWKSSGYQTSLALARLTTRQVAGWIRRDAGKEAPDSLVAQIYERTRGVPLLVEEFTSIAREATSPSRVAETGIPGTLQQVILARLESLSSNREVAQYAATLGRDFDYETLAAVAELDPDSLEIEINKLIEAGIIRPRPHPAGRAFVFKHALLLDALVNATSSEQRRKLHRKIADVLEVKFPSVAESQPELLAQHLSDSDEKERAVTYWLRAGRRSSDRFAIVEAISHLTRGLDLLKELPESPARDAHELELLGVLGPTYIAVRGYAAPEVGPVFDRARILAARSGETPQTFAMLRGHFAFRIVRGEFRLCAELAEEAVQFAERLDDPGILMEALFLRAVNMMYRGDFAGVKTNCSRALGRYDDRERTAFWATQTGENSGVTHRCYLALALWHLGQADRALAMNREARDLARAIHHPFSLEYALHHTGWLHHHCRLGVQAQMAGEEEMRIATEQGFQFWHASGTLYYGAGLLLRGQLEEGLTQFQKGLEAYRASGAGLGLSYYLGILAEAFTQAGRFDDARVALDEAHAMVEKNDERFHEAELYRLRGELHLTEANEEPAADHCFQRACEIAREQGSRAWELRATMSLARLRMQQERRNEAFNTLTAVFNNFQEGLKTPDLVDAAALLKDLGNERMRDDVAAGIRYVRGCIPPPMQDPVAVDWRYIPSSTLGGDTLGYHWLDKQHLAFYLIDVTGHGLDSALLAVTITNVIRTGSLPGADLRQPDQVLFALNKAFQGPQHGNKYFTIWYGVYHSPSGTLSYASGGHPSALVVMPDNAEPRALPATGPIMGMLKESRFEVESLSLPQAARLYVFSDGVFEVRRDKRAVWELENCLRWLAVASRHGGGIMDGLLAHVRDLHGSFQLDDDFSIIEARFP